MPALLASPASPLAGPLSVSTASSQKDWDDFVGRHPDATGYHLWQWRYVFERAFRHRTEYLIARRAEQVVGVLPLVLVQTRLFGRFAVSLPFVNYGGILTDGPDVSSALLQGALELARENRLAHVALRHRSRQFDELPCRQHKVAMLLPLPLSADDIWAKLDRKARNQVRKAEKSGLDVEGGGPECLPSFYRVFAENMRDLGTPVYSNRLFEHVFDQFPESTRVFLVRHNRATVAAAIAYRYRDRVEVPWAASLSAYRHMSPNNLLYWRIIEWAIADGLRVLDFGRSTPGGGTYRFKSQWGALPHPLFWEYGLLEGEVPDVNPQNPRFQTAINVWRRLPVGLTRLVGPSIVRGIP